MNRFVARAALAAIVIALVAVPSSRATTINPTAAATIDPVRLEALVDRVVKNGMQRDRIAGVGVAVVGLTGPLLLKGYGLVALHRDASARTMFHVQSISKTFVWIALMQLVEAGKIRLDDPINAYLPADLRIPDDGFTQPITVRNLMSHTPGFEDSYLGHLFVHDPGRLEPFRVYLARYRVHRVRAPGEIVVYSNYGGALGGAIVEQVTHLALEDYAEQRILRPLGMGDATFRQPYSREIARARNLPAPIPSTVVANLTDDFRPGTNGPEVTPHELTSDVPAGALIASPTDMASYMEALLAPERMERLGVLKARTVIQMRDPLVHGPAGFGDMRHGFEAVAVPGGYDAFGHKGDSVYSAASMVLVPSLGLGVFVAANTSGGEKLVASVHDAIIKEFFSGTNPFPVYGANAANEARALAGEYRNLRRPYFRTEHGLLDLLVNTIRIDARPNGDLTMTPTLSTSFSDVRTLVPLGGGVYREKDGPERVAFRTFAGRTLLYTPYADTALEPIGYFQSLRWVATIFGLTILTALTALAARIRRGFVLRNGSLVFGLTSASLDLAAIALLVGFGLFGFMLVTSLGSTNVEEVLFSYPPTSFVAACWFFAISAVLTMGSVPGLVPVPWLQTASRWRRAGFVLTLAIFAACVVTFWTLGFLGFSGW